MRLASASGVAARFSTTALPSFSAVETASALAGIAVALVLAFRNKSLLTVALGACATVFVVERLLALL